MQKKKMLAAATALACWSGYRLYRYPVHPSLLPMNLLAMPGFVLSPGTAALGNQMIRRLNFPEPLNGLTRRVMIIPSAHGKVKITVYEHIQSAASPCLVYFHGGGFCFADAPYIHEIVMRYAKETPCTAVFVHYRTSDHDPYPVPFQDCCAALKFVWDNHASLHIDPHKIAVGGDSAGGCLAAVCAQWSRDHAHIPLCFQMLIYPVTDVRMMTPSMKEYKDSPFWNAGLNKKMWDIYLRNYPGKCPPYASPMQAEDLSDLPDAYIETEEFDCLRDEGILYAKKLCEADIQVQENRVKGTFHGFDFFDHAAIAEEMISIRINALKKAFK